MKLFIGAALLALALAQAGASQTRRKPSGPAQGSQKETLVAQERRLWSLIKARDLKGLAGLLAEDYYEIFPEGNVFYQENYLK